MVRLEATAVLVLLWVAGGCLAADAADPEIAGKATVLALGRMAAGEKDPVALRAFRILERDADDLIGDVALYRASAMACLPQDPAGSNRSAAIESAREVLKKAGKLDRLENKTVRRAMAVLLWKFKCFDRLEQHVKEADPLLSDIVREAGENRCFWNQVDLTEAIEEYETDSSGKRSKYKRITDTSVTPEIVERLVGATPFKQVVGDCPVEGSVLDLDPNHWPRVSCRHHGTLLAPTGAAGTFKRDDVDRLVETNPYFQAVTQVLAEHGRPDAESILRDRCRVVRKRIAMTILHTQDPTDILTQLQSNYVEASRALQKSGIFAPQLTFTCPDADEPFVYSVRQHRPATLNEIQVDCPFHSEYPQLSGLPGWLDLGHMDIPRN